MTKKQKSIFSIFSLLCLILFGFSFISPSAIISLADDGRTIVDSSFAKVNAYNNDGNLISLEKTSAYSGGTAYVIEWKDLKKFNVSYNSSSSVIPPEKHENENDKDSPCIYTLSISVEYLQGYIEDNEFDILGKITLENVLTKKLTGQDSYKDFDKEEYGLTLDLENGLTGTFNNKPTTIKGWGIYRFTVSINGADGISNFYYVKPSIPTTQPKIQYKVVSSSNSLHDSFDFSLSNEDEYKYIDPRCLVWYATGTISDGTKYVLQKKDLDEERFIEYTKFLYESDIERTGQTFHFNDNEIAGRWEVWCEYTPHTSSDNKQTITSDVIVKVDTLTRTNKSLIVWIIVGVCAVALVSTATIAFVRSKKDKVW